MKFLLNEIFFVRKWRMLDGVAELVEASLKIEYKKCEK